MPCDIRFDLVEVGLRFSLVESDLGGCGTLREMGWRGTQESFMEEEGYAEMGWRDRLIDV